MAGRLASKQAGAWAQWALPLTTTGRTDRTRAVPPPKVSEVALHRAVAELLDWMLLPPAVWTTFPAGWGKMTPAMKGMLRGCGLKAGMPDVLVFYDGRCIGIELKLPGRKQSCAQTDMTEKLRAAGVGVYVAHSPDEVLKILGEIGIPCRKGHLQ